MSLLVSATEAIDDTPVGQLMHGILATFNEYQSRQSGADIAYKMGQKARKGGTQPRKCPRTRFRKCCVNRA